MFLSLVWGRVEKIDFIVRVIRSTRVFKNSTGGICSFIVPSEYCKNTRVCHHYGIHEYGMYWSTFFTLRGSVYDCKAIFLMLDAYRYAVHHSTHLCMNPEWIAMLIKTWAMNSRIVESMTRSNIGGQCSCHLIKAERERVIANLGDAILVFGWTKMCVSTMLA